MFLGGLVGTLKGLLMSLTGNPLSVENEHHCIRFNFTTKISRERLRLMTKLSERDA